MDVVFPRHSQYTGKCWMHSRRGHVCVGGEGTTQALLSPCQPHPSMISDFLMDGENLAQSELLYVVRKELTQTYSGRVQRKNPFSQERFKEDSMTKKLAGKVALVTGASSGIGEETAG